ncbi:MAG: aldo/keto reductase, partial [Lewinella sp.]
MTTIEQINLGKEGLKVSREGLGCMGMSNFEGSTMYGAPDEAESLATIHRALELGVTMLDTADMYGPYDNERLLRKALAGGKRDSVTLATKFGWEINDAGKVTYKFKGDPAYVRKSIER